MRKREENKLSMARAVQDALGNNTSIVGSVPAFGNAKTELDQVIQEIDGMMQTQIRKVTSADKTKAMNLALDVAIVVIGAARAYALKEDKPSMAALFNYSRSELVKMRDTQLVNTLTLVHDNAVTMLTQLADYGITAAQLTQLQTLTADYNSLLSAPRANILAKSVATQGLATAFEKMDGVLARLDNLAVSKRSSEAEFYNTYTAARKIVDSNGKGKSKADNPKKQEDDKTS